MAPEIVDAYRWLRVRCAAVFVASLIGGMAWAQSGTPVMLRGTMKSVADGGMIGVTMELVTDEGKTVNLFLNDTYEVLPVVRRSAQDIKEGTIVAGWGSGDMQPATGIRIYSGEVPAAVLGTRPWDRPPGSSLTTGRVTKVVEQDGRTVVTVASPQGEQRFLVSADTPVFATGQRSTDMSLLAPGSYLVIEALLGPDGTYTTGSMLIAKDGFKPPL
jgi:hypothetical protein